MTPNELRAARRAVGLTQAELARRFGCTDRTIRRFERGEQRITQDTAVRLLEVLSESREAQRAWREQVRDALARLATAG